MAAPQNRRRPKEPYPILVENSVYLVISLFTVTAGTFAAVALVADTSSGLLLALISLSMFVAAVFLLFGPFPLVPVLAKLVNCRSRWRRRWESALEEAADVENKMRTFRTRHPLVARQVISISILVQLITLVEIWIVLTAVGLPLLFHEVLAVQAATRVIRAAGIYVPAGLGIEEAGAAASFFILGLSPVAGLSLAVVRRLTTLCWVSVGMSWLPRAYRLASDP